MSDERSNDETTEATTSTSTEPPPAPAAPPERRLMRIRAGKMLGGVANGLAHYTGSDPVVWRIGIVLGCLFSGGAIIVAYFVAWLVMPEAPDGALPPPPRSDQNGTWRWIGAGIVLLGLVVLFQDIWSWRGSILWGLALVGIGIALWGRELSGPRGSGTDPAVAPEPMTGGPVPPAVPPQAPTPASPPLPQPPPAPRERSILGRLVFGAAILTTGIAVLLDSASVIDLRPKGLLVVLLLIIGAGLLVGTLWGRARWLIFPGLFLVCLLSLDALIPTSINGAYGEVLWQPTSAAALGDNYEHAAGEAVLDLSRLDAAELDHTIQVRLGFGELLVILPDEIDAHVTGEVQGGEVQLFGKTQAGWNVSDIGAFDHPTGQGTLTIDASVGFGELIVDVENQGRALDYLHRKGWQVHITPSDVIIGSTDDDVTTFGPDTSDIDDIATFRPDPSDTETTEPEQETP